MLLELSTSDPGPVDALVVSTFLGANDSVVGMKRESTWESWIGWSS